MGERRERERKRERERERGVGVLTVSVTLTTTQPLSSSLSPSVYIVFFDARSNLNKNKLFEQQGEERESKREEGATVVHVRITIKTNFSFRERRGQ